MKTTHPYFKFAAGLLAASFFFGCSTGAKKTTPELSKLEGKKVALVEIDAEPTARSVVEVALINQLVSRGSFILVSKGEIEAARKAPDISPTDLKGIARKAGADYALTARVLQFDADNRESYSAVEEEDSQLEAERGDGKTERIVKQKSLAGIVRVQLQFSGVSKEADPEPRTGIAEAEKEIVEDSKTGAIHLPPKMRFLESLANEAFRKFFDQYQ